ncbi:hypothetical protein LSH36_524g00000 [Paralvinella palmiformis]|uniref:Uncharacterized protein n=1 Tax=Paralvinella palmiformis TaxID=53620 RepID=A0AAD9MYS9_9ANNE|nr:hypothetical protein LSH36_524g00000 [Paralvinella palmiformis]
MATDDVTPFFFTSKREQPRLDKKPREGGRYYLDRYCDVTNEHLVRSRQPFGWIDERKDRFPPEKYDTCRGRAAVRWGPNKAGERTRSHYFGESPDRYTTIDMYRRPATNYSGRVVMDCGRPGDGYYTQKFPSRTTWFGAGIPLNRTEILSSVYPKTSAEYEQIKATEQAARAQRIDQWPEFSEYTSKYLMHTKTEPRLSSFDERKKRAEMAKLSA